MAIRKMNAQGRHQKAGAKKGRVDREQANLLQRVSHELRGASVARPVGASRRSDGSLQRSQGVGGSRADAGAWQVRRALPRRRYRRLRRLSRQPRRRCQRRSADLGERSEPANPGDGPGDGASRVRVHEFGVAESSVHLRAADLNARSPDQGQIGVERRRLLSRKLRTQLRPHRTPRSRRTLRLRRRIPRSLLQALGVKLGKTGRCWKIGGKRFTPIQPGFTTSITRAGTSRFTDAIYRSRPRSGHRCCTRPGRRREDGSSRRATRSAYS